MSLAAVLDVLAVVPEQMVAFVDLADGAAPAAAARISISFVPVPPSPPPWSASAPSALHPARSARA